MKTYWKTKSALFVTVVLLMTPGFLTAQGKQEYKNIEEAMRATGSLMGKSGPRSLNWIENGNKYSYITTNDSTKREEIRDFDPRTGKDELVFDAQGVTFPDTNEAFSYRSFQWAHDSRHILFETNFRKIYRKSGISDYYVYSLADKKLKAAAKNARTAELSPDGSMVGYERGGNMFMYDFASKTETQLTNDATKDIFNGHYDWVYEEEFGQPQAWNWSPDSKYIAYWQFDESDVPIIQISNFEGLHNKWEKIPIPQVGDPNPHVRIGVLDVKTHKNIWLDPGIKGDYYIPRIYWTSEPNTLAMMVLNRAQDDMKLYFFNVTDGSRRLVMEEKNNTWVAIFNFYTDVNDMIFFPEKIHEFFWVSDRSGFYQIYRYDYDGKLLNRVTNGNWDVIKVLRIDPGKKLIYYTSAQASPLDVELYSIGFDGKNEKRLSKTLGYHQFDMSPNSRYYIDTYSDINEPRQVELWNTNGKMVKKLEANASVEKFLQTHEYSPYELFSFETSDSVRLDCSMIKPFNFDSTKKYPVILAIYGGPESHSVYNSFAFFGWDQWLAQNGYIVVDVNNRGTANYGSHFEKILYEKLGYWESNDFVQTARYLATLPYVDGSRMAIMGTSYGGYSTIYTMLTHPGVFKVGIANSPVTDWRLYDDIYTERYMGLLSDNEAGYIKSDCMTYADSLRGKLLVVHSMMDDNVHPINTMQLLTALTNAGKDVDLRIFPPGAHGAVYNKASGLLLARIYNEYLNLYLKGNCSGLNLNK
ncbi:MAG: S9 family peptidase [Bacteroidetes bacterium]|jgi:dipeptidyl-peptidase-4|nr:S9 family peptidase [Bacteroidota bacterium]MCL5034327.1 S9 family peptidase [Bacteroidota bacterium]